MKIAAVEAIPIRIPRDWDAARGTAGSPNTLSGAGDYRWSKDYPTLYPVHFETALVSITLDNGLTGMGEAQAPLAPEVACTIVERLLRPVLLASEFSGAPEEIESLWNRLYATMRVRGQTGGFMLDAISGVDLALWDLAGQMAAKPVALLLNPAAKSTVPAYLSGLAGDSLESKIAYARRFYDQGFRVFKLYYESDWSALLAQIDALHRELDPTIEIAVDALWHLDPTHAAELASQLDNRQVKWLECPLMPEDPEAHRALANKIRTPLALGESYRTCYELAPFFQHRVMAFVQPDLGRCGITESLRIAKRAAELGMEIVPHVSIAMGPQIAAAVHLAAALPNCRLCEYNPRVLDTANRHLAAPLELDGPTYRVPQSPGLAPPFRQSVNRP